MIIFWIIDMLLPICMILLSILYKKKAEKNISKVSGFRTKETLESPELWKKAHYIAAKYLKVCGICLILLVILTKLLLPMKTEYISLINVFFSLLVYIGITIVVNKKIKV